MKLPEKLSIRGEYRRGMRERCPSVFPPYRRALLRRIALVFLFGALGMSSPVVHAQEQHEDEIVANLAGGRAIVHVAKDVIVFAAINQPVARSQFSARCPG